MKQMTKNSALKRLNNLTILSDDNLRPISKRSLIYQTIANVIEGENFIRPCYSTGSGKWTRNVDNTWNFEAALRRMNFEFTSTNDSPRGGMLGKLIIVTTKIK